ncbi:site-specific integrase [Arthrobacter parietis]|uniref:site-specific integrase n=1 Tax=Arthrobacter parietis TaxID=271434 RepID=UPI0031F7EE49
MATTRAYQSDLRDVCDFWERHGVAGGLDQLEERHVFAYLVSLMKTGRSPSTVRRRLTALRAWVTDQGHPAIAVDGLHRMEGSLLRSATSQTAVMIASDDAIVREGLTVILSQQGILTWAGDTRESLVGSAALWDYVLVWLPSRKGIDPYSSVNCASEAAATGVVVVALYPGQITDLFRLRLAEAGVRYALPQWWLSDRVEDFPQMITTATLPTRFHLETPLALRQELGFQLSGQLAPLLAAAMEVPEQVWRSYGFDENLVLTRSEVQKFRKIAAYQAGVPPSAARYSTGLRSASKIPDWREVRKVVRQSFNFRS